MIKTVKFVSQQWMENIEQPRTDTAVISITSPGDNLANIRDGFHAILRLNFDDLYEEIIEEEVGSIPDADLDGVGIFWHNLRMPDANHAKLITQSLSLIF